MDFYLQQMAIGLSVGMTYALIAIGFTLIFGVLNVVNFAHGEVYTIGAFAGLLVVTTFAPPLFAVLLAALAVGALAGVGLERLASRPFRRFSDEASLKSRAMRESTLMSSLALSIIAREGLEIAFGSRLQSVPASVMIIQRSVPDGYLAVVTACPHTFSSEMEKPSDKGCAKSICIFSWKGFG